MTVLGKFWFLHYTVEYLFFGMLNPNLKLANKILWHNIENKGKTCLYFCSFAYTMKTINLTNKTVGFKIKVHKCQSKIERKGKNVHFWRFFDKNFKTFYKELEYIRFNYKLNSLGFSPQLRDSAWALDENWCFRCLRLTPYIIT